MAKKDDLENEENQNEENQPDINDADDNFGLPDVSYEPIERTEEETSEEETPEVTASEQEESTEEESLAWEKEVPEIKQDLESQYGWETEDSPAEEATQEEEQETDEYGFPINKQAEETNDFEQREAPEKSGSKTGIIVTLVIVLLLAIGAAGYYFWYIPKQENDKLYQEKITEANALFDNADWNGSIAKYEEALTFKEGDDYATGKIEDAKSALKKIEDRAKELKRQQAEAEARAAQENQADENLQEAGTVETISARTGRYYVVIASAVDGDLAKDHADRLAEEGYSLKIIEPFGTKKFHRITVDNFDNWDDAEGKSIELKGTFGEGVWVLKY